MTHRKRMRAEHIKLNREIVRRACWMDVSDWLLSFDFAAVMPKVDHEERTRADRVALMVNERAKMLPIANPKDIVKIGGGT